MPAGKKEINENTGEMESGVTLEEAFEQLEEITQALEAEDISLEDSFAVYQRGMQLLKYCNDTIDKVEKKVLQLNEEGELHEF